MKISRIFFAVICLSGIIHFSLCQSHAADPAQGYSSIKDVPQPVWDTLAKKKIYFGHHSVGANILEGVRTLLAEHPNIHLDIVRSSDMGPVISRPSLVEGGVGKNFYPETKIEGFSKAIEQGYGKSADLAFFKFCFVDFSPETDVTALFTQYKKTMDSLRTRFPNTTFAAVTTPLTCYAPGLAGLEKRAKDLIKKIIGKVNIYDHSSANRFNKLLLATYQGSIPIFDLAKFESTNPDGTRNYKRVGKLTNYELVPEYTTDGGHLNKQGQRLLAEQFLLFLASTINQTAK